MQEEIADVKDIDMAMVAGTGMTYQRERMGPLQIADVLGLENVVAELEALQKIHGDRFKPAAIFYQLIQDGRTGREAGAGFLEYAPAAEEQAPEAAEEAEEAAKAPRQYIKIAIEDRVATLTIDHPPVNAFNPQVLAELSDAVDELNADPEVKVVVITGAGQIAFVAGAEHVPNLTAIVKEQDLVAGEADAAIGPANIYQDREQPQALHCRHQRGLPGRRAGTRHVLPPAHRRRPGTARPTGNQPGHHPRLGRHATPCRASWVPPRPPR